MKEENEKEGTFSKLDLNRSGISNITSDSDFFDVDDLFIDEYDVLSFSKCQRKTFTIDFYVKNDFNEKDFHFYYKRLQTLLYSLYSIISFIKISKKKNSRS